MHPLAQFFLQAILDEQNRQFQIQEAERQRSEQEAAARAAEAARQKAIKERMDAEYLATIGRRPFPTFQGAHSFYRLSGSPESSAAAISNAVGQRAPGVPVYRVSGSVIAVPQVMRGVVESAAKDARVKLDWVGNGRLAGLSHTVRPGDTLGAIARKYNTTATAIFDENRGKSYRDASGAQRVLTNPDLIYPGLVLDIPGPAPAGPVAPVAPVNDAPREKDHTLRNLLIAAGIAGGLYYAKKEKLIRF